MPGLRPRLAVVAGLGGIALALAAGAAPASSADTGIHTISGPITVLGSNWFTLQTAGRPLGVINALTRSADRVASLNTPYVWGGGHAQAGIASAGARGPGYNGRRRGFDCSGSVAAVLAGAGLWPAGAGVPADNGIIAELRAAHLIAPGVGTAPTQATLYDDPGVHIFMNIDGRFFGTSDGSGGGNPAGGAGWLDDGAGDASSRRFQKWHFLPSVLRQSTLYGNAYTFVLDPSGLFQATQQGLSTAFGGLGIQYLRPQERVRVSYLTPGDGHMVVSAIEALSGGPVLPLPTTTTTSTTPAPTTPTAPTGTTSAPGTPTAGATTVTGTATSAGTATGTVPTSAVPGVT